MDHLSQFDPTGRFTGLAEIYARHRPSYPAAALDFILEHCGLRPGSLLVDVGSGTGISSRQFAMRGLEVIGIEPNADMRNQAGQAAPPSGTLRPQYRDGTAEATGLSDGAADGVLAAQAFHWFDPAPTLAEFQRILKPGGWVVLLWNERDETDTFTAAYGSIVGATPEAAAVEMPRGRAGEPLLVSPLFQHAERRQFANSQSLDEEGILGRALSASYAPKEPKEVDTFVQALREVFARFQHEGKVVLRYQTTVVVGQRAL